MKPIARSSKSIPFFPSPDDVTPKTMYLGTREIPKIDGSQGGELSLAGCTCDYSSADRPRFSAFIGVVVALSVLIVVCCTAVFYLLRHHEPTDQERAARRERYQRSREQTLNSVSASSGPSTLGSGSLGNKVKQIWQSTTGRGQGGGGRRGGRGWIRAGSDDGWTSRSGRAGDGVGHDPEGGDRLRSLPVLGKDKRGAGTAADGVRVVESPLSDAGSGFGPGKYGYMYTDPFAKTGSDAALQRSQSPLSSSSSPMSSPRGSASADESREAHSPRDDPRHRSAMSSGSVWTHGSKFVEDI